MHRRWLLAPVQGRSITSSWLSSACYIDSICCRYWVASTHNWSKSTILQPNKMSLRRPTQLSQSFRALRHTLSNIGNHTMSTFHLIAFNPKRFSTRNMLRMIFSTLVPHQVEATVNWRAQQHLPRSLTATMKVYKISNIHNNTKLGKTESLPMVVMMSSSSNNKNPFSNQTTSWRIVKTQTNKMRVSSMFHISGRDRKYCDLFLKLFAKILLEN